MLDACSIALLSRWLTLVFVTTALTAIARTWFAVGGDPLRRAFHYQLTYLASIEDQSKVSKFLKS